MSLPAISVRGLGKRYQLGATLQHDTLRDHLASGLRGLGRMLTGRKQSGASQRDQDDFWAIRDISFDVQPGEIIGVIGRNGAGKSTLLKVLAQITAPSEGEARIRGRVSSLLEVGTGFHPELSGLENIYLNGSILGMSRSEIRSKLDAIIEFSGVEKFLETPVKRYSSGMYVRLAFSVAAHLDPEILIIDEVLAVGDAEFQKKCLGKMQEVAGKGRTVLFVSHQMQSVSTLTQKALMLGDGRVVQMGPTAEVVARYFSEGSSGEGDFEAAPSEAGPTLVRASVLTDQPGHVHSMGKPLRIEFEIATPVGLKGTCFSFQVCNATQQPIAHLWVFDSQIPLCRNAGRYKLTCVLPDCRLYLGNYSLTTFLAEPPGGRLYERLEGICQFKVEALNQPRDFPWYPNVCTYLESSDWKVEKLEG